MVTELRARGETVGRRVVRRLIADQGIVFRSDRGSQYASAQCRVLLRNHEGMQSMSGTGNC